MVDSPAKVAESPAVQPGDPVANLDTPTILADLDRMDANIRDWQAWMDQRWVKLRVHVKTHKVPEIGVMQVAADNRVLGRFRETGFYFHRCPPMQRS